MVRINGLFHLPINGVYWGYNLLILSFDPNFLGHPSTLQGTIMDLTLWKVGKTFKSTHRRGTKKTTQQSIHPKKIQVNGELRKLKDKNVSRNKSNILTINRQSFVEGDCKIPTKLANSRTAINFHKIHL